jgi:arginine/lysine/ornithine decarboxylase
MDTPICDFVRRYAESGTLRLHMPRHKGVGFLGMERLDLTEIQGADSLYEAEGIIARSEENAAALFGCPTYYATEGSSQCIRAMLYLALLHGKRLGLKPLIAAFRNAHKTFLSGAALLDLDVAWLYPEGGSYLSCNVTPAALDAFLAQKQPAAVYLTSPDYLGNVAPVREIAAVCHRHGALLLVDNAHGAYLRFLEPSRHPMDLGADLCCDSAHKTLPVLTGGAYLHTGLDFSKAQVKNALALFGSTSPSYLILQSLDGANAYLSSYVNHLKAFLPATAALKTRLERYGYTLYGTEPLKITIKAKPYGYLGTELADSLRKMGIECEFSDPDFLVLMVTPETGCHGLQQLEQALISVPPKPPIPHHAPKLRQGRRVLSIREAMLSPWEEVPVGQSMGRILAAASVGCPPAVPILVCGERIDEHAQQCFDYYGIERCCVVIE